MRKVAPLMKKWRGMAPDQPRDEMSEGQTWLMQDYVPLLLGSKLESRQGWTYYTSSALSDYVTSQLWVNTIGGNHHLAATTGNLYDIGTGGTTRLIGSYPGMLWPMATLFEYVCIPRINDQLPVFLRYPLAGNEIVMTTHASTPPGKVAAMWNGRFVLANGKYPPTGENTPNRIFFLDHKWPGGLTESKPYDPLAWFDTSADITGLAVTRQALLVFHEGSIERLRGTVPPGTGIDPEIWIEPLMGQSGCNEPHTICYWNDNVVFADAKGVYMTDGTTLRDISTQGGIGEEWRRFYDPIWRVSAGVVKNQYIIAMTDITNKVFKKCFVCDLNSRSWQTFTNIPCSSFVASSGEIEKLFGGGVNGRIIDITQMYRRADSTTDTLDGDGTPVLPQLETAWYQMSDNMQVKRLKALYFAFNLDEASGSVKVYGCKKVQPDTAADWTLLKTLQEGDTVDDRGQPLNLEDIRRRVVKVGMQAYGMSFKIETVGTIRTLKLHALEAELLPSREETYVGAAVVAA